MLSRLDSAQPEGAGSALACKEACTRLGAEQGWHAGACPAGMAPLQASPHNRHAHPVSTTGRTTLIFSTSSSLRASASGVANTSGHSLAAAWERGQAGWQLCSAGKSTASRLKAKVYTSTINVAHD